MNKKFRAGVIGCGCIGALFDESPESQGTITHAGMYERSDDFELTCAAESDPERAKEFARHWDVGCMYSDHLELLANERLEVLSIASPDDTHAGIILEALRLGPPLVILSEKPLSGDLELGHELARRCREQGVLLVVNYVRRWDMATRSARKFLSSGSLGPIHKAVGHYVRGVGHNGCQLINLMRFLLGDITAVQNSGPQDKGSLPEEPSLDLRLFFSSGFEGWMLGMDQLGYCFSIFELDIFGSKGRLRIIDGGRHFELYEVKQDPMFPAFQSLSPICLPWTQDTLGKAMREAASTLAAYLRGELQHVDNGAEEAICDMKVIRAGYKSALSGNIVQNIE